MGLGPPVCQDCMRIMDHEHWPDAKGHKYWRCERCGKDGSSSTHLFAYPKNVAEIITKNSKKKWWMKLNIVNYYLCERHNIVHHSLCEKYDIYKS